MDFDTQLRITLRFQCKPQAYCNVSLSTDIIGAKGLKPFARFFAALRMTFWAKSPPWQGGDLGEVSCHPTVTRPFTRPPLYENISSVRCDQMYNPTGPWEKGRPLLRASTNGKGLSHTTLDREVHPSCCSNGLRTPARSCRFLLVCRRPMTPLPHGVAKAKTICPRLAPVPRGDPLPGVYQALYSAANSATSLGF